MRQAGATPHRRARVSHYRGLSCCGAQAPDAQAQWLWLTGLVAPRHVGSSQTRAQTRVPCISRQILNYCTTREARSYFLYDRIINVHFLKILQPLEASTYGGRRLTRFRFVLFFKKTHLPFFWFFKKFIYLFIYFWLCWAFVSVRGLSLVATSGGHSSSRCAGLSLSWPLLLWSTGSRRAGSVVVAHRPSCSAACGIFPDQGLNPCPVH